MCAVSEGRYGSSAEEEELEKAQESSAEVDSRSDTGN